MDKACAIYEVHLCSVCPGDTEYFCESCPCNLCVQCNDNHVKDLKTKDHNVMRYSDKFTYIQTETRSHASFSLFYKPVLLTDIKADVKTCIDNFSLYRSEMLTKAQRIIDLIDVVQNNSMNNLFCDFVLSTDV